MATFCHPTFALCRLYADYLKMNHGGDVSACRSTAPGVTPADRDASAHWWCVSSETANFGSCDRSRRACELTRDFLRTELDPSDLIECAPQQTASCFELQDVAGRRRRQCQPSLALCQAAAKIAREDQPPSSIGDCRPVD